MILHLYLFRISRLMLLLSYETALQSRLVAPAFLGAAVVTKWRSALLQRGRVAQKSTGAFCCPSAEFAARSEFSASGWTRARTQFSVTAPVDATSVAPKEARDQRAGEWDICQGADVVRKTITRCFEMMTKF